MVAQPANGGPRRALGPRGQAATEDSVSSPRRAPTCMVAARLARRAGGALDLLALDPTRGLAGAFACPHNHLRRASRVNFSFSAGPLTTPRRQGEPLAGRLLAQGGLRYEVLDHVRDVPLHLHLREDLLHLPVWPDE